MKRKNRFGEYIATLRREKGISQTQLGEGLCTKSEMCRFERGERLPDKLMQNRFLTRLGVAPENYENFLYYDEYCRWEKRQGIIHNILDENIEKARELLEAYRQEHNMQDALENQFYLAMLAQIRRYEKCDEAELSELFKCALALTVPGLGAKGFMNKILSLEEMNLLLEYIYCSDESLEKYEELLKYIEKMESTLLGMAKIFPKTVYYYYVAWNKLGIKEQQMVHRMLELCNRAIELLRDANRLFYMWELFGMKEQLVPLLETSNPEAEALKTGLVECHRWRETLESIYQEAGVGIAMYEFCYLYVESENYCIGDVIRIRRKMLGLSQEKLAENICDPRSVSKLERNLSRPQREVVQLLFERLNLSTELNRTELVTDNPEAVKKYKKLRIINHVEEFETVTGILEELRQLVSEQIPSNRQILLRKEINIRYKSRMISKEEYIEQMKDALGCTLSYEKAIAEGKKYFTNEELYCILNITVKLNCTDTEVEENIRTLLAYCERPSYPENYLRMYQFLMAVVASHLGNKGEFEQSCKYEEKSLQLLLKNRRLGGIHEALYELIWNYERQCELSGRECNKEKIIYELNRCIEISKLVKNSIRRKNYEDKLEREFISNQKEDKTF